MYDFPKCCVQCNGSAVNTHTIFHELKNEIENEEPLNLFKLDSKHVAYTKVSNSFFDQ